MDNRSKLASMSEARFVQSLLLATPLYFYYQHLTPPGYFSGLLKGLAELRVERDRQELSKSGDGVNGGKRKTYEECENKAKKIKPSPASPPRADQSAKELPKA